MAEVRYLVLLSLAAVAACSDGAGNSLTSGVRGTIRSEYGRVSQR